VGAGLHVDIGAFEHKDGDFLDILLLELRAVEAGASREPGGTAAEREERQTGPSPDEFLTAANFSEIAGNK